MFGNLISRASKVMAIAKTASLKKTIRSKDSWVSTPVLGSYSSLLSTEAPPLELSDVRCQMSDVSQHIVIPSGARNLHCVILEGSAHSQVNSEVSRKRDSSLRSE